MTMTGDELRALRTRARWKQSQLATVLKITPQYVGMLERGEKEIMPNVEDGIRAALGEVPSSDFYVPDGKQYQEAKNAVVAALSKHPGISLNGFPYRGFNRDEFEGLQSEHESRARLFSDDSLAQVATALAWIDAIKTTKTPKIGSYGAKHSAERWGRENGFSSYVANGALIVAAVYRDVPLKRVKDSPNALLGLDPDPKPEPKRGSFAAWLHTQAKRRDPVGDFARDAIADRTFPIDTSSGPKLRSYMRSKNACEEALEAMEEALAIWRASRA